MSAAIGMIRAKTFADMLHHLGDVPPSRVRFQPYPARDRDVVLIQAHEDRNFELVDGLLVEKAMGIQESFLAVALAAIIWDYVRPRKLGIVTGADGMLKLSTGLVRIPDVSFISWSRMPGRKIPKAPIPKLAPDLAVEVLSKGNTAAEMKRKRREYFKAGTVLVWIVNPRNRTVSVYTSPTAKTILLENDTLDGGDVLPGFTLPLHDLFAALDEEAPE